MNFVADECVPRPIVERLRTDGHSVAWITQEHPGISDPAVLQLSIAASATLLTIDTDFGELIFRTNQASIGVVLLRLEGLSNPLKAERVSVVVHDAGHEFAGRFTVVTPGGIRSRPLQP